MTDTRRIAIIGAGPAGLAAAHRLAELGQYATIFEAGAQVGGLARSISLWDRPIDLGPHVVAGGERDALALWSAFCKPHTVRLPLRRGIIMPDRVVEYPIRPIEVARQLSPTDLARSAWTVARARVAGDVASSSAEDWIVARYGRALYDVFLRSYIEKLCGVPGTEIDASFARTLFGAPSPASETTIRREPASATFDYPDDGCSGVWQRLIDSMGDRVKIELNAPVESLCIQDGAVRSLLVGGTHREFDRVISTMPIGRLVRMLSDAPAPVIAAAKTLRARHIVVVHLLVRGMARLPHLWLYVHDAAVRVGRVSDYRNWHASRRDDDETVLTMEYWCGNDDEIGRADAASLVTLATSELVRIDALRASRVIDGHALRLANALPMPTLGHGAALDQVRRHVGTIRGLTSIGRHGGFSLSSVIDVVADGLRAADDGVSESVSDANSEREPRSRAP